MTHAKVAVEDIIGNAEAAERLNVSQSTITQWRKRHPSFPTPFRELRCGPLYLWPQIAAWYDARQGAGNP